MKKLKEKSMVQVITPTVVGKHVFGNLYDCDPSILSDQVRIDEIIKEAANIGNMTLLDLKSWKIGEGVSAIGIILESHISIHTWPEYNFATVDAYSCGAKSMPMEAFMYIVKSLKSNRYTAQEVDRSSDF